MLSDACRSTCVSLKRPWPNHSLDLLFQADRNVAKFNTKVRSKHVAKLEEIHDELHEANAGSVLESIRRKFVQNVKTASLPHAQLSAEQKEHKVVYNRGRRELEHEFGKTMRYKSIRDLVAGDSGRVIQDLKPVWLMSPLSVSDTLPLDARAIRRGHLRRGQPGDPRRGDPGHISGQAGDRGRRRDAVAADQLLLCQGRRRRNA